MSRRYAIGTATVVMLVVLRLNIGWHFFSEGVTHYNDPYWTSEPVLRAATGPLAPLYRSYLPDFHGMSGWLHSTEPQSASTAIDGWIEEVQRDSDARREQFALEYGLDEEQQKRAVRAARDFQGKFRSWTRSNRDALEAHIHQHQRMESKRDEPEAADVPFQGQRLSQMEAELAAEARGWRSELAGLETNFENALARLLSADQSNGGPPAAPPSPIDVVDTMMTYVILVIGLLLLVGLFTRTACLAGAVFLLSVVMTQPFWVSESQPTFNQNVEMFALLMLATTHVGRWAGLDFFVHNLILGRQAATKGKIDEPES